MSSSVTITLNDDLPTWNNAINHGSKIAMGETMGICFDCNQEKGRSCWTYSNIDDGDTCIYHFTMRHPCWKGGHNECRLGGVS
jgi:hypothetical protein